MFKLVSVRPFVLLLGCVLALSAHSRECFELSPNFLSQGDEYYDLEAGYPVPLADQKQFIALASQLDGDLAGVGHKVECLGSEKNPRLSYQDTEVKAKITSRLAEGMRIHAELRDQRAKTIKGQSLAFLGNVPSFQFFNYGNRHFSFSQKMRHKLMPGANLVEDAEAKADREKAAKADKKETGGKSPLGGNRLEELIVDVQFTGTGVLVRIDHYANGLYYATENLELSRAR